MLEATRALWWRAFVAVGVTTGLRVIEMLWLAWDDIDEAAQTVSVASGDVQDHGSGAEILRPAWPIHRERVVPTAARALTALNELRAGSDPGPLVFVPGWKVDQLWPLIATRSSVPTARLAPGLPEYFRHVQRFARLQLAGNLGVAMEQVRWTMRPLSALRNTYAARAVDRYGREQAAEYLGLASVAALRGFRADHSSVEASV